MNLFLELELMIRWSLYRRLCCDCYKNLNPVEKISIFRKNSFWLAIYIMIDYLSTKKLLMGCTTTWIKNKFGPKTRFQPKTESDWIWKVNQIIPSAN